ncbi:MAG: ATP-binding protein [Opitutales bacterium]
MCASSSSSSAPSAPCASPERLSGSELASQIAHFAGRSEVARTLDRLPIPIVLLNSCRQLVFANRAFLQFCRDKPFAQLGERLGEAVGCENAHLGPDGCGSSHPCSVCGALRAIFHVQRFRLTDENECLVTLDSLDTLELEVQASPYETSIGEFVLLVLRDISERHRRQALERTFFHDILNTAGGLYTVAQLWEEEATSPDLSPIARHLTENLIEEIQGQRTLLAAQADELRTDPRPVQAHYSLDTVAEVFAHHGLARERHLQIDYPAENFVLQTDSVLLRRVLVNMVKNAFEATPPGGTVQLRAHLDADRGTALYEVHNATAMPREVQLQVFRRSFSTKGEGRGLGTYSMRLFGEKYLGGRVSFTSDHARGTTFRFAVPLHLPL